MQLYPVVDILTRSRRGSGVLVARNVVLTAAHVCRDEQGCVIGFRQERQGKPIGEREVTIPARLLAQDIDLDLAVLLLPENMPVHPLKLSSGPLRRGAAVVVEGYPGGQYRRSEARVGLEYSCWLSIDHEAIEGESGGPIRDMWGDVVSLVAAAIDGGITEGPRSDLFTRWVADVLRCGKTAVGRVGGENPQTRPRMAVQPCRGGENDAAARPVAVGTREENC